MFVSTGSERRPQQRTNAPLLKSDNDRLVSDSIRQSGRNRTANSRIFPSHKRFQEKSRSGSFLLDRSLPRRRARSSTASFSLHRRSQRYGSEVLLLSVEPSF